MSNRKVTVAPGATSADEAAPASTYRTARSTVSANASRVVPVKRRRLLAGYRPVAHARGGRTAFLLVLLRSADQLTP
jgi:hypothetical protein